MHAHVHCLGVLAISGVSKLISGEMHVTLLKKIKKSYMETSDVVLLSPCLKNQLDRVSSKHTFRSNTQAMCVFS